MQKVSPLKELVTNMLGYCPCKKPVIDPTVHQGRPGQGLYQCNLKYEHAVPTATVDKISDVHSPHFHRQGCGSNTDVTVQMCLPGDLGMQSCSTTAALTMVSA